MRVYGAPTHRYFFRENDLLRPKIQGITIKKHFLGTSCCVSSPRKPTCESHLRSSERSLPAWMSEALWFPEQSKEGL